MNYVDNLLCEALIAKDPSMNLQEIFCSGWTCFGDCPLISLKMIADQFLKDLKAQLAYCKTEISQNSNFPNEFKMPMLKRLGKQSSDE
jgi:hypothetical protein